MIHFRRQRGFTIVELLIVVILIAIIAAITVVSFRGFQDRASRSAIKSTQASVVRKLELYRAENSVYPASITDCPSPAANNICITPDSGTSFSYFAFNPGVANRFGRASIHSTSPPAYELAIKNDRSFLYYSTAEITGEGREFTQYADLAPLIDAYGLRSYEISFDIVSANIATTNTTKVYMQNGSGSRYSFNADVPVTTSYQRQVITVTPTGPNTSFAQSILAFYGTYGTGNRVTVKNVQVQPTPF